MHEAGMKLAKRVMKQERTLSGVSVQQLRLALIYINWTEESLNDSVFDVTRSARKEKYAVF
jgi:hypothetical protein